MKASIYICMAILLILACKKSNKNSTIKNGVYVGTFNKSISANATSTTYPVEITFNDGKFSVKPEANRKPAGGSGTYVTHANKATFTDTNNWSTDFDWTDILYGEYVVTSKGDSLTLTKEAKPTLKPDPATSYATITYQYILKKEASPF